METSSVHSPPPMPSIMPPPPYQYYYNHHHHSSDAATRPSIGFPLGTALLLVVIFSLSGIFSCCYHWDKFRSLQRSYEAAAAAADLESGGGGGDEKAKASLTTRKEGGVQSLPVIMPGDHMPKFIALPCPCAPLRTEIPPPSSLWDKQKEGEEEMIPDHAPTKPTTSSSSVPTTTTAQP